MERGMTADQVLMALWRRKALVGALVVTVFAVGATFVALQPSLYTATSVYRMQPQRPSTELVQHTVSELLEQRLLTVRQELLSRPVLQAAIQEFNLYPEVVSKKGLDAAVEEVRKHTEVKVSDTIVELSCTYTDAETAAKLANRLPELYASQLVSAREAQAARATHLFVDEMGALKNQVANWEKRIAQFKVDHLGELPEQLEVNMRTLERIGGQLNTRSEELRVAEGRRSDLARAHYAADTEAGRMLARESAVTQDLLGARSHWTADHPEVRRLEGELALTTQQRKEAEGRMSAERQEKARVTEVIARVEAEIQTLHQQADAIQARLERTPRWAHELSTLQTDYDAAKAKYLSVVSRKVEAEIAQELELRGAKDMFLAISTAAPPAVPSKPDRLAGLLIALLGALALGVLTAVMLELRDDSLRDLHEVKERLPLPVLAVVPNLANIKTEKRVLLPAGHGNRVAPPPGPGGEGSLN